MPDADAQTSFGLRGRHAARFSAPGEEPGRCRNGRVERARLLLWNDSFWRSVGRQPPIVVRAGTSALGPTGRKLPGRYGPFASPSLNGSYLRIPAEDRSRRLRIRDRNGFKATLGYGDASWFFLKNVRPNTARSRPHRQPQRRMQRNRRVGPTTARPLGRATGAPDRPKRGTVRSIRPSRRSACRRR